MRMVWIWNGLSGLILSLMAWAHNWDQGGSFWHVADAQQHEQTNTSIIMRSWVSGESFRLAESHLSICSNCFHIFCRFCMYTYAKSKSVPDVALQEQCTLSWMMICLLQDLPTVVMAGPWLFCASITVSNRHVALGCKCAGLLFLSPQDVCKGLAAVVLPEMNVVHLKGRYLHYDCAEKAFLLEAFLFLLLNPLYISLDYSYTAHPL